MSEKRWTPHSWFVYGEIGISSEALMRHIHMLHDPARSPDGFPNHPHDPADFRRCVLAIEHTNSRDLLHNGAELSPVWKSIIGAWDELCAMMDGECAEWREKGGRFPKTYERMRQLIDAGRKAP